MDQPDHTENAEIPRFKILSFWGLADFLRGVLDRWQPPEEVVLVTTALFIGIGAGLGAIVFRYLITGVDWVGYTWLPSITRKWGMAYVILVPALGGALVGPLVYFFAREAKGHGVPEVMEAVALRGGRIRPRVALVKALASSLSIGSGGSVGREGPIVQIGSALGSAIGQALHLSSERTRNLVACGAAGGIAATFNSPIAGVIFALEVILGRFSVRHFSTVVISAVTASVIGRQVFGNVPAFAIPTEYGVRSLWEYGFYPFLGVAAALVGVVYVRLLYWSEDLFARWKSVPEWFQPAIGGGLLGILALVYPRLTGITWERIPQIFNVGYNVIEAALANQLALGVAFSLLILKLLATSLTLGSGGSGGVFAPSLFIGAMLGATFELLLKRLFPDLVAPAGAYALVGMAALFAASAHAPITAVIILFELTGDYRLILPLMLTVVIATLLAQSILKGESIYTLKLSRRGVRLQSGRDLDVLQGVSVKEVMSSDIEVAHSRMTLSELSEYFSQTRHHGLPVVDAQGNFWGLVTVTDIDRAIAQNLPDDTPVEQIGMKRQNLLVAYPDETMGEALTRMGIRGIGRLPVIAREDPNKLIGVVRRHDIIRAYQLALTRRAELQHRTRQFQLRNLDGTDFIEILLQESHRAAGMSIRALAENLPQDCILVSVRRDGKVLIPHGDTVLQAGDRLTAFVNLQQAETLRGYLCDQLEQQEQTTPPDAETTGS